MCCVSSVLYVDLGAAGVHAAEQPLTAAIRTYKSSPKRREAVPSTPVQHFISPARTTSYSLQKASLRRSLSPNIERQAPALRQPQWDSSKRPSPQRAQRTAVLNPAYTLDMPLDSPQRAQHAAEGSPQPGASSVEVARKGSQVHQFGKDNSLADPSQKLKPQVVDASAVLSSAAADSATTASAAPGSSSVTLSNAAGIRSGSRGQTSRTPTPSPPRFRRLPPIKLTERPAWASTTTSRAAPPAPSGGAPPLQRSVGSTITTSALQSEAPPPPPTNAAPSQDAGTSKALSAAPRTTAVSVSQSVRPGHLQALSESHAEFLADSQAHAHAHALQRLQQAVEDYHSSSPHVLVPAAVELAAALRRAAKGPAPARPSLEALQLAGLKLKHEGGEGNSAGQSAPTTPWPEWVRGAWGSPQARVRGAREPATAEEEEEAAVAEVSSNAYEKENPQRAQRHTTVSGAKPACNGWSPVKRPESLAGRRRSAIVSRALAEAEAAAARSPQSGLARLHNPPRPARASTTANPRASATPPRGAARVSATPARSAATPPRGAARHSRVSAPPHRAAATPSRATQQAELSQQPVSKALAPTKPRQARSPSTQDSPAAAAQRGSQEHRPTSLHASKGQPPVEGSRQSVERAKPPPGRTPSVQSKQRETAMQAFGLHAFAQHTNLVRAGRSRGHPALMQVAGDIAQPAQAQHSGHAERAEASAASSSHADFEHTSHAELAAAMQTGKISNSNPQPLAVITPLHSVVSVAALRQSFEQMSPSAMASVDSVKPRNRLPLRKVSSKAHVHEDDGSPQQASLLWQQSLRGADDGCAEDLAEPDQAMQPGSHSAVLVLCSSLLAK